MDGINYAENCRVLEEMGPAALSQLINALEGARKYSTSAYVSSFDMSKAFDSVGWKFLIRCLIRLRIR